MKRTTPPRAACLAIAVAALLGVMSAAQAKQDAHPKNAPRIERSLAVYLPEGVLDARVFIPQLGTAFAPGEATAAAAVDAARSTFRSVSLLAATGDEPIDAVLTLHPKWEAKGSDEVLTLRYRFIDAAGTVLAEGEQREDMGAVKLFQSNEFYQLALSAMKDLLDDDTLPQKLGQGAPARKVHDIDPAPFVDRDKAVKTGTGFYINAEGQIITAAHVVHGCPLAVVKTAGKTFDAHVRDESLLLDLAVIDTHQPVEHFIPLRESSRYELGEGVTNIGFPLDGILIATPNVTRGNVSSRTAMPGSLGQFQFSAPVQPGSSGGPVISESGELLGVTVATMNVRELIEHGVLPQNVNFALDARYVASFMDRDKIRYTQVAFQRRPEAHLDPESMLPAVVQLLCYE